MKKIVTFACLLTLIATAAFAQGSTSMGGFGFRQGASLNTGPVGISASPTVGIRQWFTSQMGADLAVGFVSTTLDVNGTKTDEGTGFAFDLGLPISMKSWDKVNVIFRPGFAYESATAKDKTSPTPPNELKATVYAVTGELEVEYMMADKLSISAAHGIAYSSTKIEDNGSPVNEAKLNGFGTIGNNFTTLGFHVYLW
jgi:hypothetical protein